MLIEGLRRDAGLGGIVSLALVEGWDLAIAERIEGLDEELAALVADLTARYAGKTAGQIETLAAGRALYRAIGLDPTRHRPSPEALMRRLLRGEPFPRRHPAVDLANLWAVVSGLPVGLYDTAAIRGTVIDLRLGRPGESYPGIDKPPIHLEGRLTLADDEGPFGNPTADSLRTAVGPGTAGILAVMFAPAGYGEGALDRWGAWMRERVEAYFGGRATSAVLP